MLKPSRKNSGIARDRERASGVEAFNSDGVRPRRQIMKVRIGFFCLVGCLLIASAATEFSLQGVRGASGDSVSATYSPGIFHVTIPYRAHPDGAGQLAVEILDPVDSVLGRT